MLSPVTILVTLGLTAFFLRAVIGRPRPREPPQIKGLIPYISTSIQYMTDAGGFIARVKYVTSFDTRKGQGWGTNKTDYGAEKSCNPPRAILSSFI